MGTTRVRHEHSQDIQGEIIRALKHNIGDSFTSAEIAESIGRHDVQSQHVASVLKGMVKDGLVERTREPGGNLYSLTKKALAWQRAPYNWRVSKGIYTQTTAQCITDHFTLQDTDMFIPVPPPPGIAALSIDQPPLSTASLAMAPDILGTEPPPVPISFEDEAPPPILAVPDLPEAMPVEPKVCRCVRVVKLPPLPDGLAIKSIKLVIVDSEDRGNYLDDNAPRITISTTYEGYLDWEGVGIWSMNSGDMAQVSAVGDALLKLHIESQSQSQSQSHE
jgi:hypothetical protein